jgi:hypothetical protein
VTIAKRTMTMVSETALPLMSARLPWVLVRACALAAELPRSAVLLSRYASADRIATIGTHMSWYQ